MSVVHEQLTVVFGPAASRAKPRSVRGAATSPPSLTPALRRHGKSVPCTMDSVVSAPIPSSGLYCFGDNSEGNLGTGDNSSSSQSAYPLPIELSVPVRFVSVASGLFHSLALTADGTVWSWGRSENGRLGHGNAGPEVMRRPCLIEALAQTPIAVIGAGYHHSMALSTKSQLYCWGSGWSGQLGLGTNKDSTLPSLVDVPTKHDKSGKMIRLAAGYHHSLVLTDGGRIYSWGTGDVGQLGLGPQQRRAMQPTLIAAASEERFVAISASENHSVALTDDGRAYSWGYNRWKQLGHEHTASDKTHLPQPVSSTVTFSRIAAGSAHTIAISKEGQQLYYWGRMVLVGDCISTPKLLDSCVTVSFCDVSTRLNHCLALTKSGELWSFGYNEFGQCGLGHASPVLVPTLSPVTNGLKFSSIVAGGNHSIAIAQHESLQNSNKTSSPSSSSEDLRKNLIRVDLSDSKRPSSPDGSQTSPRGRASRISISKVGPSFTDQLALITKREADLRTEREALRAQQRALDDAVADWTLREDELVAERNKLLREAGLM